MRKQAPTNCAYGSRSRRLYIIIAITTDNTRTTTYTRTRLVLAIVRNNEPPLDAFTRSVRKRKHDSRFPSNICGKKISNVIRAAPRTAIVI